MFYFGRSFCGFSMQKKKKGMCCLLWTECESEHLILVCTQGGCFGSVCNGPKRKNMVPTPNS